METLYLITGRSLVKARRFQFCLNPRYNTQQSYASTRSFALQVNNSILFLSSATLFYLCYLPLVQINQSMLCIITRLFIVVMLMSFGVICESNGVRLMSIRAR